ncbi:hypothetical protein ACC754_38330, partial [Rhizobium johnstonii]
MSHRYLANEGMVPVAIRADEHDREVAGDTVSPEGRPIPPISLESGRLPHGRVRKYHAPGHS